MPSVQSPETIQANADLLRHLAAARARSAETRKARSAERKAEVLPIVRELQAAGAMTLRAIAHRLNAQGIPAPRGGQWGAAQVRRVIAPTP